MGRVKKTGPKFAEKKGDKKNVDTPVKDKGNFIIQCDLLNITLFF